MRFMGFLVIIIIYAREFISSFRASKAGMLTCRRSRKSISEQEA